MDNNFKRTGDFTSGFSHNYFLGNGIIGMFIDPLGSQTLPSIVDYSRVDLGMGFDAGDKNGSAYKASELECTVYKWHRNNNPSISSNDAWIEWMPNFTPTPEFEHSAYPAIGSTIGKYGRGQLFVRQAFFPIIDEKFQVDLISDYNQHYDIYQGCVKTEYTYDNSFSVSVWSGVLWCSKQISVFHMEILNNGQSTKDIKIAGDLYAFHNENQITGEINDSQYIIDVELGNIMPFVPRLKQLMTSNKGRLKARQDGMEIALKLKPDEKATVTLYFAWDSKGMDKLDLDKEVTWDDLNKLCFNDIKERHISIVKNFWSESAVELPDDGVQKLYDMSLATIAGNIGGYYPPCVGSLTNSSYFGLGWGMDNLPLYDVLLRTGHVDRVKHVKDYFIDAIMNNYPPTLSYNFEINPTAPRLCHSFGSYAWMLKRYAESCNNGENEKKELFSVLSRLAGFILDYAVEEDDKLIFPTRRVVNDISFIANSYDECVAQSEYAKQRGYEYAEGDHLTDVVSSIKWILNEASSLAFELNLNNEKTDQWMDAFNRIEIAQNDKNYLVYPGDEIFNRHIQTCAVFHGVYPLGNIIDKKMVDTYYNVIKSNEKFFWNFSYNQQLYGILARLGLSSELDELIYESPLKFARAITKDGTMFTEGAEEDGAGTFLYTYGCILTGIHEALFQDYDGWIRPFPAVPTRWDSKTIKFKGLTSIDGLKVDGIKVGNEKMELSLLSACDTTVNLELQVEDIEISDADVEKFTISSYMRMVGYNSVPVKRITFTLLKNHKANVRITGNKAIISGSN